ncbi:MAG: AEC family transporter [Oscillospiraceae bacterium]|nr:AEC family transporter [Oscillospiraceae bacterium]
MEFSGILTALFKLFFLLIAGYVMNKLGLLDARVNKGMTSLVVNLTNPALILGSLSSTGAVTRGDVLTLLLFGVGMYILLPAAAFLITRLMRVKRDKRGIAELLLIFGNTGFMAIPILQALYGDVAVFYISILNVPFNFLIYSYGVWLLGRDRLAQLSDAAQEGLPAPRLSPKSFLTPGIICSVVALIMYFARLQFPVILGETFSFVGGVTPPLSMLIIGSILAEYPLKNILSDVKIKLLLTAKLLFFPVAAFILAKLFFTDSVIVGIVTLIFSMPCASLCTMLSKEYGVNTDVASSGVVFTTVLSLVTIPLVYLSLSRFF